MAFFFASEYVSAEAWNWQRPFKAPEKNIEILIISGNYRQPRIIADLIQNETQQPIIILPSKVDDKAYFLTGDRSDTTMEVKKKDFTNFVKFCNPDQILVLGGKDYIPEDYLNLIDSKQTIIRISNSYWLEVAKKIQDFFNLTYLVRDYKQQVELINSGRLYEPTDGNVPNNNIEQNNNFAKPVKIDDDSYTPPAFKLKEVKDDSLLETKTIEEDIKIIEPIKPIKEKTSKPTAVIPKKDKKIIDEKAPSEPKLIDENQFLPK